jgi:predicted PhzF superfamily epimerase YddE/YHI9
MSHLKSRAALFRGNPAAVCPLEEWLDDRQTQAIAMENNLSEIAFKSGILTVKRDGPLLSMDFPSLPASLCDIPDLLVQGLGVEPEAVLVAKKYLVVYDSEEVVRSLTPDMNWLCQINTGVIITARSQEFDFISRMFAPCVGVPEDPVTGSAHCTLVPYWSEKLNKTQLHAFQASKRGGELFCEDLGDRVSIAGQSVTYLEGRITL